MSNSVRPHRRQPTRLPRPWDSPGKNTGVGCHFLLQCMKVKSESEVAQSCPTLRDPMDCSPPGSSVHGIFQARVLESGAIAFSNKVTTLAQKSVGYCRGDSDWPYVVVLLMSCTLCSGSMVSGQRRMQGANTMAKALADIRLVSSCRAILRNKKPK